MKASIMHYSNFADLGGRVEAVEQGGQLFAGVHASQDIPDQFLTRLRDIEDNKRPGADMVLAASIPVIFVEKWMREGFNIYQESVEAIEARLKREGLEAFLVR